MAKSHSTISTYQLLELIPDEATARQYIESRRWPQGPHCPCCGFGDRITTRKRAGYYRCNSCREDFTVRTGTIFERSHVPLRKWLMAMYLLLTSRKGISSLQLSKQISVTQKTAWFMLHRLREACGSDIDKLRGTIEIDETYIGGRERAKHDSKKLRAGRGTVGKTPVLAMRQRHGRTTATPVERVDTNTVHDQVHRNVEVGSTVHTDEAAVYDGIDGLFFRREAINHSAGEYARGNVTTNSVESVFALLKRGLHGVYHHASRKHLARYVNEFTFRLNEGSVAHHTLERLDSLLRATINRRLTYAALTGK